jgi:hypothetical protein
MVVKILEMLTLGVSVIRFTPRYAKLLVRMMIASTLTLTFSGSYTAKLDK